MQGPAVGRAEGRKSAVAPLEVDARGGADGLRQDAGFRTERVQARLERFPRGTAPAADAEDQRLRDQRQRVVSAHVHPNVGLAVVEKLYPRRRRAVDGEDGAEADALSRQQLGGDRPDPARVCDRQPLHARPVVKGEDAVSVGRGGDHRLRAADARDLPRQRVGPAEVARQQGHREIAALVHRDDGGVGRLAVQIRRDCPHRDARRADEDQGAGIGKRARGPVLQGYAVARAGDLAAEHGAERLGQRAALFGEGEIRDLSVFHVFPSRKPVVKDGS